MEKASEERWKCHSRPRETRNCQEDDTETTGDTAMDEKQHRVTSGDANTDESQQVKDAEKHERRI